MKLLDTAPQAELSIDKIVTIDRETDKEQTRWRVTVEDAETNFRTYGDTPHEALMILAGAVEQNSNGLKGTALYEDDD